jgi:hypothetical protein
MASGSRSRADTGRAVQAAARLDHLLLMLLLMRLDEPVMSKTRANKILATFGLRRRLAHEMGLIDDATNADLKTINAVRGVFAHAEEPITFRSRHVINALEVSSELQHLIPNVPDGVVLSDFIFHDEQPRLFWFCEVNEVAVWNGYDIAQFHAFFKVDVDGGRAKDRICQRDHNLFELVLFLIDH